MSFFSAKNICTYYGKTQVLHNISFELTSGELLGILGSNGCGKTTLLKSLCGILPHEGFCTLHETTLEHCNPRQLARLCSYIPQRSGISIDISALDVVLMGFNPHLGLLEHPNAAMRQKAKQALALTGLGGKEQTNYMHLSEGQKQLCILARTLVSDSRLLLLDEPESALDFHFRYQMLKILQHWSKEQKGGAVVTLHDPVLALNYCDKLLLLSEGKVLDLICPKTDPLDRMEHLLSRVYGTVSLHPCHDRKGNLQLLLMKEESR